MRSPHLHGHSPGHSFPPPPCLSETSPGGGTTNTGSRVLGLAALPRGPRASHAGWAAATAGACRVLCTAPERCRVSGIR